MIEARALKAAKILTLLGARTLGVYSALKHSSWRRQKLLILGYHGISQDDEHRWRPGLYMPPDIFASRMEAVSRMGCAVLSLDQAITHLQAKTLPPLSVVITFDDGYHDFFSCAYPILKCFGYPVTVYQTTFYCSYNRPIFNLVSSYLLWKGAGKVLDAAPITGRAGYLDLRTEQGIHSAYEEMLKFADSADFSAEEKQHLIETLADSLGVDYQEISKRRLLHLMTKDELSQLAREGVDIQLHTHRHRVPESKDLFIKELTDNQRFLKEIGQPKPIHFAYPSGIYREECFSWLSELGIRSATTGDVGLVTSQSNLLCLPRFMDTPRVSGLEFEAWLCGIREVLPSSRVRMKTIRTMEKWPRGDSQVKSAPQEGSHRLKVLVLGEEIFYPPDSGRRIRTWSLLRRLAKHHSISYLCYGRRDDPAVTEVEAAGIHVHLVHPQGDLRGWPLYFRLATNLFSPYPYSVTKHFSRRFLQKLRQLLRQEQFHLLHCEGTHCARFLAAVDSVPRVLGTHNIEWKIWSRRARQSRTWIERLFFASQAIKMRWFERRALLRAESAIAVTPQEVQQMQDWGVPVVTLVPNGVDLEGYQFPSEAARASELLFLGALDWYPNLEALDYFLTEILPLVLSLHPEATFRIVGRRPPESLRKLVASSPHVELVADPKDVRPHLARAGIVVVPLRIGGGSRLKILEALAAGKAVVSTSVGAEGLELTPGKHFQVADGPLQFAQRTAELIASEKERRRLGENGKRLVAARYGWDEIAAKLEAAWFEALGRAPANDFASAVEVAS